MDPLTHINFRTEHNSLFAGEPQPLSTPIMPVAKSQQTPSIISDLPLSSYSSTLPSVVFDTLTSPEQYQEQDYVAPPQASAVTQSRYIKNPNSERPSRSKCKEKEKEATTSSSSWYYIIGAGAVLLIAMTAYSGSGSFRDFSKSGTSGFPGVTA